MDTQKFMSLSALDKVEVVNKMLENEGKCHLKNVASKLGLSESTFSKIMRDNSSYQYNKTSKQYDRILPIEEYKKFLESNPNKETTQQTLEFISHHFEELKQLLNEHRTQLILEPEIYAPSSETITKTIQVNSDIYRQFSELHTNHFSHYRLRDIFSKCLLDFIKTYQKET